MTSDDAHVELLVPRSHTQGLLAIAVLFTVGFAFMLGTAEGTADTTFNPAWGLIGVAMGAATFRYMTRLAAIASTGAVVVFMAVAAWQPHIVVPLAGLLLFGGIGIPVSVTQMRNPRVMWVEGSTVWWRPRPWRAPVSASFKHVTRFDHIKIGLGSVVVMTGDPGIISRRDRPAGGKPDVLAWVTTGGDARTINQFVRKANWLAGSPPDAVQRPG